MMKIRGIEVLQDEEGSGELLQKGLSYWLRIRMWLHKGDPVVWARPAGLLDGAELSERGLTAPSFN
jgi:hypothetical protein